MPIAQILMWTPKTHPQHPASTEVTGGVAADQRPSSVVWDLQGEQEPCPCGCSGCDSTLISRTLCPPILLPAVLTCPARGAHGRAAEVPYCPSEQ